MTRGIPALTAQSRASAGASCRSPDRAARVRWILALALGATSLAAAESKSSFHVEEATIADIQQAILSHELTATQLVKLYLARIKAYNGPGVEAPDGMLGIVKFVSHAKGVEALISLNLRPEARKAWGFDEHAARSLTDPEDKDPNMPDALEVAADLDRQFAQTGKLVGPLHGVVMAIKDQYDTFDMRTTAGADVAYANDRPPEDATFVKRLRAAGAIILAKANLGEYANGGERSSFGGLTVNPYDTERSPGGSSAGSGAAVAANLVTCAIAEETTSSIRNPARYNSEVGIAATQELVSRYGMIGMGINTRVGPITRTVEDSARILTVIAGYDPKDPLTAFADGRLPASSYESFTHGKRLDGVRIGVVREYMAKKVFTKADEQSIDLTDQAIEDLKKLGATIVDPGPDGELFTKYIRQIYPLLQNAAFTKQHPDLFAGDQIERLVDVARDSSQIPGGLTLRDIDGGMGGGGPAPPPPSGESRYALKLYLRERNDPRIKDLPDLISQAHFYNDARFADRKAQRESTDKAKVLDMAERMQHRFAVQEIVLQAFADMKLDAVVYPSGNLPPPKLGAARPPMTGGRGPAWVFLGMQGFPAITVPAGFTSEVYDWVQESKKWVGPVPAKLPVGVDFLGRPFSEPKLFAIAAAYEQATRHRTQPPDFGPLPASP